MTRGAPGRGARVAGAPAGRRGRSAAAAAAGRGLVAGAERAPRRGQPLRRAHPRPARRRRRAALRMRADPERRGGLSPTTPTASPRCTTPGPSDPPLQRSDAAAGACQPLGVPHAARRRAGAGAPAPAAGAARRARRGARLPRPLGRLHRRPVATCGKARCCWPRSCCGRRWRAPRATSAGAARSPACSRRCSPRRSGSATDPPRPATLLANRLDVLERSGLPEAVLLGYRTMARIAGAEGAEHRALELLGALDAVGVARSLPRLRIASLADQVRLHARRFRAETCRDLCAQIDALLAAPDAPQGPLWRRSVALLREVAHGLRGHRGAGLAPRRRAAGARRRPGAQDVKLGRLHIELLGPARLGARPLRREVAAAAARGGRPGAPPTACCASSTTPIRRSATGCARRCPARRRRRPARGRAGPPRAPPARRADAGARRRRAWRSRRRSARCWSCWRATSRTRRSGWRCRWAKRPSSGT